MTEPTSTDKKSFFQRHMLALGAAAVVAIVLLAYWLAPRAESTKRSKMDITMVNLATPPPPPPPPLPPPPVLQKQEEKMIEQAPTKSTSNMDSPEDEAMRADSDTADAFGLIGSRTGKGFGGGRGRWGWYASAVQTAIQDALRKNPKTRNAALRINVRLWPDASGNLSRVELADTTGDPEVDRAIEQEVLSGLKLQPPPPDMPRPMHVRLIARKK